MHNRFLKEKLAAALEDNLRLRRLPNYSRNYLGLLPGILQQPGTQAAEEVQI